MTPSKIASVAAAALMTLLAADVDHGAAASTAEAAVRGVDQILDDAGRRFRKAERFPDGKAKLALYREVETLASQAIDLDPDIAQAHFLYFAAKGRRLLDAGLMGSMFELSALRASLDRALELDPDHAHALATLGGILLDLPGFLGGDEEQALVHLARAVELNPTGPGTRLSYAKALIRSGNPGAAREHLTLAAHYAAVTRRGDVLREADQLLTENYD